MSEMAAAVMASDFSANHAMGGVFVKINATWECCIKAWPATARIVFGSRAKQLCATVGADVDAIISYIEKFASKWTFSRIIK